MITKAILPVGGLGTRFLPATKAVPKELLPIFDTPAIELIVQDAVDAGIEEIIIVTGPGKDGIRNHFEQNYVLEQTLKERGKHQEHELVQKIHNLAKFEYALQQEPLGDGHAILCAQNLINEDESVVVLFGDDLVDNHSGKNSVQQLLEVYEETQNPVVLLEEVPNKDTKKYGIVEMEDSGQIRSVVEKPDPADAPSNCGIVGKYIITPKLLEALNTTEPGPDGEIRLSNAFLDYIEEGGDLRGKVLEGIRFDTGDKIGFLEATLYYAHKKEEEAVRNTLENFFE